MDYIFLPFFATFRYNCKKIKTSTNKSQSSLLAGCDNRNRSNVCSQGNESISFLLLR